MSLQDFFDNVEFEEIELPAVGGPHDGGRLLCKIMRFHGRVMYPHSVMNRQGNRYLMVFDENGLPQEWRYDYESGKAG